MYKLTFKNYILISLVIIAIISLLLEDTNFIRLIITKIISLLYLIIFTYKNIISKQANI
jgi:hypothetical protein